MAKKGAERQISRCLEEFCPYYTFAQSKTPLQGGLMFSAKAGLKVTRVNSFSLPLPK